jgi:biopolymer transport protein ExbB/TolQ
MLHDIFDLYRNGEAIPFIMLAFLCIGFIIIFEKFFAYQFVYKINFEKFNAQIRKMLLANDMVRARNFSRAVSKTGIPLLAVKAIDSYESDPMRVRATLSEEALRFFPRVRRRMTQLPNLAAASVILGALAAVYGIWSSFQMVEGLELGIKSFAFSKGLTLALLPLSISLMVAVMLMLPYGILDAMAWRLESEMEHTLCVILNILAPDIQPIVSGTAFAPEESALESHAPAVVSEPAHKTETNQSHQQTKTHGEKVAHEETKSSASPSVPDEEEII